MCVEAFEGLGENAQIKLLGPAKFAAWKDGKIRLNGLVGRKFDPRWGWMRYEKSLVEALGEDTAKGYTRLALMGVAQKAGDYAADDLIRLAGLGLRELTASELNKIMHHVAEAGFDPIANVRVLKRWDGLNVDGVLLKAGNRIHTGYAHYIKHVLEA